MAYFGWQSANLRYDNRVERFAVGDRASEQAARALADHFGTREYFLAALQFRPGRTDPALGERIFDEIAALAGVSARHSLRTATGGVSFPPEQLPFPFYLPEQRIYTAIFELEGGPARDEVIGAALETGRRLERDRADELERLALAGEPIVNYCLNRSSMEVRNRYFPALIAMTVILLGGLFRSLRVVVVAAFSVGASLTTAMGVFALAGRDMNLATTLIPALTFVLAVAMQAHVLVCAAACGDLDRGLRQKWRPNFLVALTTSIGFGSLMISRVAPIADMGRFMALNMWIIFFWTHFTHFGVSRLIGFRPAKPRLDFAFRPLSREGYWRLLSHRGLAVAPLLVILLGAWALYRNPSESNGLNYFSDSHFIRADTDFLQQHVTGASLLELLIARGGQPEPPWTYLPEGRQIRAFEDELGSLAGVRHVLSLGRLAAVAPVAAPPYLGLAALAQARPDLVEPYVSRDYYRIQLLVNSLDEAEYAALKRQILESAAVHGFGETLAITGPLDRIIEIQRYLLRSLGESLAITVLAAVALIVLLLGRNRRVLAVLTPNLFPLGCMALSMNLLGLKTDISSVMVFSIAFGIAVDDSIHLLHSYAMSGAGRFRDRWRAALERDGRAIMVTTATLSLGFLGLMISDFAPTRTFGLLLTIGMVFALLGDALFLPLLLPRRDSGRSAQVEAGSK